MGQLRLEGNPEIDIMTRRSARARRLSLRVSRLDGRVTLTLPRGVSEREALAFAREREGWLRGHLGQLLPEVRVGYGTDLTVLGEALRIMPGDGRRVRREPGRLLVPHPATRVGARVKGWLKSTAREAIVGSCDQHAAALGRSFRKVTLRDTRSRWGSCSSDGDLMLSWRLVLAPPEVLDYVCAHEVAHLAEMNHSPAFWAEVARLCPPWKGYRDWLRDNGEALHRFRFTD